ncbi:MAG: hypothetical protein ACTSXT_00700 [Candidatus Helarchaeota archaeon]
MNDNKKGIELIILRLLKTLGKSTIEDLFDKMPNLKKNKLGQNWTN